METPEEVTTELLPAVTFEAVILDEREPVKLTADLIRTKSKALTDLKILSIADDTGYKAVKAAVQKTVKMRTAIEKIDKEVMGGIKTRHASEIKLVKDYTTELYTACREAQTTLEGKLKVIDDLKEAENQKALAAEKARTEGRENKMYELGLSWNGQAFVGPGTTIPKDYLFGLSEEKYESLLTELEGLQMEQSVSGKDPEPIGGMMIPLCAFQDQATANVPPMSFKHDNEYNVRRENKLWGQGQGEAQRGYANVVYERTLPDGIRIILTKGKVEDPEADALVTNDRVADSGVYVQVVR